MTLRLCIGIDPGMSGALYALADGIPDVAIDMPLMPRPSGGNHVNAASLAASLRGLIARHAGAYVFAVLEQQGARPGQNISAMFRMGEGYGVIRGVLGAMGVPFLLAHPQSWKRFMRLQGLPKDAARTAMIARYPSAAPNLARKKDGGRADALAIATWAELTQQVAR